MSHDRMSFMGKGRGGFNVPLKYLQYEPHIELYKDVSSINVSIHVMIVLAG